jgi:hypothetical protein
MPRHEIEHEPRISDWESLVREKVRRLRFGIVQIIVRECAGYGARHDARVVQIDRTERTRIAPLPPAGKEEDAET